MTKIKRSASEEQTISGVIVVRKLKSEDLIIYINSCRAKKDIKEIIEWIKRIAPAAVV
jgi:hypothetical protein